MNLHDELIHELQIWKTSSTSRTSYSETASSLSSSRDDSDVDRWRGGILRHFGYIEAGPSRSWSWLHYLMSSWEGEWEGNGEESIVFPLKYINQLQWREFSSIWKVLASDNSWAWVENNLWTTTNGKIPQWSAYGYRCMRSGGKWTRQCPLNIWNECWTLGEIA